MILLGFGLNGGTGRWKPCRALAVLRGFSHSPRKLVRHCLVYSRWATCLNAGMVSVLATVRVVVGYCRTDAAQYSQTQSMMQIGAGGGRR